MWMAARRRGVHQPQSEPRRHTSVLASATGPTGCSPASGLQAVREPSTGSVTTDSTIPDPGPHFEEEYGYPLGVRSTGRAYEDIAAFFTGALDRRRDVYGHMDYVTARIVGSAGVFTDAWPRWQVRRPRPAERCSPGRRVGHPRSTRPSSRSAPAMARGGATNSPAARLYRFREIRRMA